MCSRSRDTWRPRGARAWVRGAAALCVLGSAHGMAQTAPASPLRVCSDPDNLPYSDRSGSGFENRIAQVVAGDLGRPLLHVWLAQRRGFVRKTLGTHACDLLVGVPAGFERVLPTRPYYRASYVIVTRRADAAPLRSLADPRLAQLRIGVTLVGNDLAATPPAHALARRGATEHVIGYTVYGDGPVTQRVVAALAGGRLDAALLWGPQAGWFAAHAAVPMRVEPAAAPADLPAPFEFAITMGVRREDTALRDALDAALEHRRHDIDAILADYAVPRTDAPQGSAQ